MAADIFGSSPELDLRKRWALMQLQNASDASPVRHPLQAVARTLQGAMGGLAVSQADNEEKAAGAALFGSLPGLNNNAPPPAPMSDGTPRGIRNNNPGNIEDGPFARKIPGYAGSDGRFAKFDSPQGGATAMDSLLASYGARGINNVSGVINRWAPPSDNNPTSSYAATVARQIGVDPNARIDLNDPSLRQKLAGAIGQFENGRPVQMASLGNGMPAAPQVAPGGPQMAQAGQALNAPAANRASVQIPPDVAQTIQRLGAEPRTHPQAMQLYMQYAKPVERYSQGVDQNGVPFQQNTVTGEKKADPTKLPAISEVEYARKNWQQLGFPDPNGGDPKSQDFWQSYNAKRLGGSGVNVSLSTEKKGQEELASKGIGAYTDAQFAAREAQKRIGIYDRMEKAADSFKPGASADIRLAGQRWLKELGVTPGENVPEGEVLKMLGQQLAIHAQPKGQGAVSNFERDMFAKSLPNMTQSPEGFKKAVGISRDLEKFDANVAKIYRDSARAHGGIPNFLEVQDQIAGLGSPLSDQQMQTINGAGSAPAAATAPAGDPIEAEMRKRGLIKQ